MRLKPGLNYKIIGLTPPEETFYGVYIRPVYKIFSDKTDFPKSRMKEFRLISGELMAFNNLYYIYEEVTDKDMENAKVESL